MENPFEENQAGQAKRPTLLTVLCILTFIGSGFGALSDLRTFFTADAVADATAMQMEQSMDAMEQLGGSSFFSELMAASQEALPYLKPISGINCLLALLSLFGAICMFRLRKVGFYFYTGAQLLMLFVTPAFIGFGGTVMMTLAVGAVFTLLFIILYSLNLKYMK